MLINLHNTLLKYSNIIIVAEYPVYYQSIYTYRYTKCGSKGSAFRIFSRSYTPRIFPIRDIRQILRTSGILHVV